MKVTVDIKKRLGDFCLNVQFQGDSSQIGILGASGSGKSMTLKCIAGIEVPDEGYIRIGDNVLFDSKKKLNKKPQNRNIGYLFQNYALFPTMTVKQNIAAGLSGSKSAKEKRVQEMLVKFRLEGVAEKYPGQLSGGQQQRTALARIMAYEPDVILLDEPYSALDGFLKDRLQQEMQEMLEDYKGTVILVSHSRDEIYRFSEELLIMEEGQVICGGRTKEIFENPGCREAAKLTGCKNIAEAERISDYELKVPEWGVDIMFSRKVPENITYVGFRAHDFVPIWGKRCDNCITVGINSMAELPFERKYFIKKGKEEICWFVQRQMWDVVEEKGIPNYLMMPEEKILLLT